MAKKFKSIVILLVSVLLFFSVSSCKKDEVDPEVRLNAEIMKWMYDAMDEVYYWNYTMPEYNSIKSEADPKAFYKKLIYTQEDVWSWLTDDYAALEAEFEGAPTSMGFGWIPGVLSNSENVFFVVTYVYPLSPAKRAGLKRGDVIISIDGQTPNKTNFSSLLSKSSYVAGLGTYQDGAIFSTSNTITLNAETFISNPLVFDTVFTYEAAKIGYVVYTEFVAGKNDSLLNEFGIVMDDFKSQGISELIVDLRYNPGGEITAANYIASCIAPQNPVIAGSVFVKFKYNSFLQGIFDSDPYYASYLRNNFTNNGHNLNLNKVVFLTGQYSASASELLMVGLEPYMDVIKVGEQTYGKYTGAWVINDKTVPPKHNWAIVPIVSKYSNSVGFTDFKDGLVPDYEVNDQLLNAYRFGDSMDPILQKAIEVITNQVIGKKATDIENSFIRLENPNIPTRYNLYLERPELIRY